MALDHCLFLDTDQVRQILHFDGALVVSLVADGWVLEGSGIGSPLELAIRGVLDGGKVIKKVGNSLLLARPLGLVLGDRVTDKKLATVGNILLVDSVKHGREINSLLAS